MRTSGAAAGVAAGLAVAVCSVLPLLGIAVVFVGIGCVLAYGWPRLLNLPSPRGTASVLAATTLALALVMLAGSAGDRTKWAGAVVCLGLIGSFLHQLLRQDGRPRLVMSLAGTALGLGFLGSGSYLVAAHDFHDARHLLVATGLTIAAGAVMDGVAGATSRRLEFGALQVVIGAVIGAVAALAGAPLFASVITGAATAVVSWAALRTTVTNATSAHTRAQLAAGCAMALVCGFLPYAVGRL